MLLERLKNNKGTATVEFSIVIIAFVMFFIACFKIPLAMYVHNRVNTVAYDTARHAMIDGYVSSDVISETREQLSKYTMLDIDTLTITGPSTPQQRNVRFDVVLSVNYSIKLMHGSGNKLYTDTLEIPLKVQSDHIIR